MHRRPFVEALRQRPGQQVAQDRGEVEVGEVAEAGDLAQVGLQPVRQGCQQGLVAEVRPFAGAALGQVELPQQGNPRLPLAQLRGPRQQGCLLYTSPSPRD